MYYGPRQRGTVKHGGSVGSESKVETWKDWMVTFLEDGPNQKMLGGALFHSVPLSFFEPPDHRTVICRESL